MSRWEKLRTQCQPIWQKIRASRWLKASLMVLTLSSMVAVLIYHRRELQQFGDWRIYLSRCLVGFLLYPLSLCVQAGIWGMIIARLSGGQPCWKDIEIYAYTHFMKRLPGAVWYLAGRALIYQERGVNMSVSLAASGLEWFLLLIAAVTMYTAVSLSHLSWMLGIATVGACLALAIGLVKGLHSSHQAAARVPKFARQWVAGLAEVQLPNLLDFTLWLAGYLLAYAIGGLILHSLLGQRGTLATINWLEAIQIWALTGGIGFLASMIIPSGLVARELTLTALLTPVLSTKSALLIAILLRLLFVVGDIIWGGLLWLVAHLLAKRQAKRKSPPFPLSR